MLVLAGGCSQAPLPGHGDTPSDEPTGEPGVVAEGTCWSAARLGADPQDVLRISKEFSVPYLVVARAVADRPSFAHPLGCGQAHSVEVYKVLRLPELEKQLTDYATLLQTRTALYDKVARSVSLGCMTDTLASVAAASGLPGAVAEPMLPEGASLGWSPAAPAQWAAGQRVFACTLTWAKPEPVRYAAVFTKKFPTSMRTCIDTHALLFVDCARRHDRERIALIEAREAVEKSAFPGRKAIRKGPNGRYLAVSDARYRKLDAACTAYLHAISTTKKLTGVANVDVDEWPTPDGSYPIYCEADTRPDQKSLITEGSVYSR
ncbi:MAG TPA: hypothetical protein VFE07_02420 [Marmoricola sp.]|nr:hypothetical protein [Marmoricola sp.]